MKASIHPEYIKTKVHCNGCDTTFETRSTVPEITVEICSNCHPFYTGKQKLVDTAGRVDKFRARQEAAKKAAASAKPKAPRVKNQDVTEEAAPAADPAIEKIEEEFEDKTVELPKDEEAKDQPAEDKTEDSGKSED